MAMILQILFHFSDLFQVQGAVTHAGVGGLRVTAQVSQNWAPTWKICVWLPSINKVIALIQQINTEILENGF